MPPEVQRLLDTIDIVLGRAYKLWVIKNNQERIGSVSDDPGITQLEDGSKVDNQAMVDWAREQAQKQAAEQQGILDQLERVAADLPRLSRDAIAVVPQAAEKVIRRLEQSLTVVIDAAGTATDEQTQAVLDAKQDLHYAVQPLKSDSSLPEHYFEGGEDEDPDEFDEEDFDGFDSPDDDGSD